MVWRIYQLPDSLQERIIWRRCSEPKPEPISNPMKWTVPHLNSSWAGFGFFSFRFGSLLGLRFHEENWLGATEATDDGCIGWDTSRFSDCHH